MLSMQLSNIPFYVLERQKCVNLHLSIQDDCWIFRIPAKDFTRGGDKFRVVELRPLLELCLHSSISGGQIHNFSWQNSEFGSQIIKHRYPQNRSKLNSELISKI